MKKIKDFLIWCMRKVKAFWPWYRNLYKGKAWYSKTLVGIALAW